MNKTICNKEYSTIAYYEVKDLAHLLDLSTSTIYHHITDGHLIPHTSVVNKRYYIKGSQILRFVKKFYPDKLEGNK